jgi:RNA polymerase sigma factor (sigma-70 family)
VQESRLAGIYWVVTPRLALKQRPEAAFEKLYRQHVGDVYRYTLAVLGNPADAEDVTQTTFMNAYRAFHAGERPRKASAWLRTIAHNVCRQRWRQAARRPNEVAEFDEMAGSAPEEHDGPSAADITRALQSLPFNQRTALVMRELEGRRQAEIAAELDLSESAVEALLFRARRAMREQLEGSITCGEAARAISRQLDRSLSREEHASLRAHLRSCEECAGFARQARAQRGALKALGAAPLPLGLLSWSWHGAGAAGGGVAAGGTAGAGAAAGGTAGGGAAAAAAGGSALGGAAAAATGGSAAAFGLKVAAGLVTVAIVAGGGERLLGGPQADRPASDGSAKKAADSQPVTPGSTPISRQAGRPLGPRPSTGGGPAGGSQHAARRRGAAGRDGKQHGRDPVTDGPGSNGTPGSNGRHVRAHGTPTRAHGSPTPSNGNATRAHGNPSHSNGTRAHGTPAPSNGTPTRAHGSPAHSNGSKPPQSPPPHANGTPTRAHGAPPERPEKPPKP